MEAFVSYPYDLDIIFGSEKGFTCFSLINPSSAEKHIQYIVEYVNTEHPDFSIEIPESIICDDGEEITLPSIPYQEFEDGNNIYYPLSWDIGEFGDKYTVHENTQASLLWQSVPIVTITFTSPDHPSFNIDLPESITGRPGEEITLPTVTGEWTESGSIYTPSQWNIGAFGSTYTLSESVNAVLQFNEQPEYSEIKLYLQSGTNLAQSNVTSSFTGNASSTYCYQLYTDAECTIPWTGYDYSNDYIVGYHRGSDGVWVERIDSVSEMPSELSQLDPVIGYIIMDTGCLWLCCNNTASNQSNVKQITLRIYPKGKQWIPVFPFKSGAGDYDNISVSDQRASWRRGYANADGFIPGELPEISEIVAYKSGMITDTLSQFNVYKSQADLRIQWLSGSESISNVIVSFVNPIYAGYVRKDKADLPSNPSHDGARYTLYDDNENAIPYDDAYTYTFMLLRNASGESVGSTYTTGTASKDDTTGNLKFYIRYNSSKFNRIFYFKTLKT